MTDEPQQVDAARTTLLTEDWAAVAAGLLLVAAVLLGAIPAGLVP
ncbi:hypothetical protein ACIBED_18670 [Rhodococcus coprophilus]|uniref:Uncharacterized protein n=1 Tax=Rhodococcus coprophilus TaxID=38310 RepID=A0A2X4WNE5_9NOCA|nr:hypothetical protein [Rhodococcus coprophilus]MBM7460617.1 hypothetical protein [Rhodococcus coprophilus]SQI28425.1 Uncharacterised protein [Rhodococcus coprophilus]